MTDLLNFVVEKHGGLKSWNAIQRIDAKISITGGIWTHLGVPNVLSDIRFSAHAHNQHSITISNLGGQGKVGVFQPDQVTLKDAEGKVIETRANARASFGAGAWDALHVTYFGSYATWGYLTQPFSLTMEGVTVEELQPPHKENGETWRRLQSVFPSTITTHTATQIFYYDSVDGMLRRHDYSVDVMGGASGANYASEYRTVNGITVACRRMIYGRNTETNEVIPEPLLISIDITDLKLE